MKKKIFWLGGMRESGSDKYYWVDAQGNRGEIVLNEAQQYQDYWLEGEPSYMSNGEEEQYMMCFYKEDQGKWVWNDAPDDLIAAASFYAGRLGYICEY